MHVRPPKPRRLLARASGVVALAAAIMLFLTFREPREGDGTRAKGGAPKLGFYVSHGGTVRPGSPAERVLPGDGLRFVVTARDPLYLAVLSIDGARHGSVYYSAGKDAAPVSAGTDVPLPVSTTLDETLGDETIYGVFCPRPFAVEPLRQALETHPDQPPVREGCQLEVLRLRKEARPPP